jgi:hypothetical protein
MTVRFYIFRICEIKMSLIDFWKNSKAQIEDKHIQQIIAFSGDGKRSG